MNERIQELLEQAEINRFAYNQATMMNERVQEFDKEKFAELIVRECTKILEEDDGATHHKELLFEHFGVEE
jgi:predicted flavoprotein YhiN